MKKFQSPTDPSIVAQALAQNNNNEKYRAILKFIEDMIEMGLLIENDSLIQQSAISHHNFIEMAIVERPMFTMFACPSHDLSNLDGLDIVFMGSTFDQGTTGFPGARFAADKLRELSAQAFEYHANPISGGSLGWFSHEVSRNILVGAKLGDIGNVLQHIGESYDVYFDRLELVVRQILNAGAFPVILGGDHSISYPAIKAYERKQQLGLLHIDAHTDFGALQDGVPNNHGNVFTRVLREGLLENIHQFGIRSFAGKSPEIHVPYYLTSTKDIRENSKLQAAIQRIDQKFRYHLSLDIDSIDPAFAPGTGTPIPNGLTPSELMTLTSCICEHSTLVGLDIVEVNPMTDLNDKTAHLAIEVIAHILGEMWHSRSEKKPL